MKWHLSKHSKLIDALREKVSFSQSARSLKRALESNRCRVNGKVERFASIQLKKGDLIEFSCLESSVKSPPTHSILFENEDLLVLNKATQSICTDRFFQKALSRTLYLAHRLDKDTTGVLLFGKTPQVVQELHELFERREVQKEYVALVDGIPKAKGGVIRSHFVKRGHFEGQTIWGSNPLGVGLYAETEWRVESLIEDHAALLSCFPKTGRTHQIRIHLSEMGHPILIDRQYASKYRSPIVATRPLLHARRLHFSWRGKQFSFEADLPQDFSL